MVHGGRKGGAMITRQFLEIFLQDLRYAIRMLLRSPGFTATAIAALALGIGANTAIFSVVNTVLLQPLAYPEPDRLVQLELSSPQGNGNITSIPKFMVWQEQRQVFQDVAAYDLGGPGVNLTGGDRPEQLKGIRLSGDFFRRRGPPGRAAFGGALKWAMATAIRLRPQPCGQKHRSWRRTTYRGRDTRSHFHVR